MRPDGLLLIGALTAGSVAALTAWSRHLPKKPQLILAGLTGAALVVAVLDVHFFGPERGDARGGAAPAVAATPGQEAAADPRRAGGGRAGRRRARCPLLRAGAR